MLHLSCLFTESDYSQAQQLDCTGLGRERGRDRRGVNPIIARPLLAVPDVFGKCQVFWRTTASSAWCFVEVPDDLVGSCRGIGKVNPLQYCLGKTSGTDAPHPIYVNIVNFQLIVEWPPEGASTSGWS